VLTFLRRIRKSLINSPSSQQTGDSDIKLVSPAGRYLLYAFGEVILVVIGILVALQINNWNEYRKDRIKEKEVLSEIASNLILNIDLLNGYISTIEKSKKSSEILISVIENKLPYRDTMDLHFHFARTWFSNRFISLAGYEEFKNAGFDLVLNKKLKDEIIELFETRYPKTQETIDVFQDGFFHKLNDYYRNNFYGVYDRDYIKPIDFNLLVKDQYYLSTLKEYYNVRLWLIDVQNESLQESQRVLHLIKDELGESG